jgi:hypothetical protein
MFCATCSSPYHPLELHRDFVQADVLDRRPNNGETTRFCREHVDLIGVLPYIAEQAFNGVGRLNVAMHGDRKLVKRQEMLFILSQAAHRLGIALGVFGFESGQLNHSFLCARLLPDTRELGLHIP